jgi:hypothetical protein
VAGKLKGGSAQEALPLFLSFRFDGVHGTAVNASATIGALIRVDNTDITLLGDSHERTGVVASTTVDAIVSDMISHWIHLLYSGIGSMAFFCHRIRIYTNYRFLVHP